MFRFVNKAYRLLLPVIILFAFFPSFSQTYHFTAISVESGLSQSQVNCIMEDSRGFLWIGTAGGGINQYDGNNFKVFEEKDGLAGNIVNTIEEDHYGNIWVGSTWGGLSVFDGKKFKIYTKDDGLLENNVISICRAKNNQMLVAFNHGINILAGKSISEFHTDIFANHTIHKLFRDKSGNIWILTDKSLFIYNGYSLVDLGSAYNVHFPFSSIAQDKNGNIWLGTYGNGLYILSKAHNDKYILTPYTKNEQLNQISTQSILIDKENNIWLGTNDFGIVKYDFKNITFINQSNGFPNNNILSFCEDHYGNIWFGTTGSGLIKYFPCPFSYFDNVEGFKRSDVFAILCDKKGGVWAADQTMGLYRLYNGQLESYDETKGILSRSIRALAEDKEGRVWVGTKNGLNYIEKGKVHELKLPLAKKYVRALLCDRENNLWISIYGEGLLKYNGKEFKMYTSADGLNHNYIHSLLEDKKGNIWIGTGNGINRMKQNGEIENFVLGPNLCNKYIGSMAEDSHGNIWFGTDRCLIRYNGQEFSSFTISDELTSNTIYLLATDKKGQVYVGTNKGVDKISTKPNGDILDIKNYGISEGFKGLECNSRSVAIDSAGNIFFGTIKGVIKYLPANDKEEDHRTSIHITNVRLFPYDKTDWSKYSDNLTNWFKLPNDLVLPYSQNNISFDFTGINLFHPEKVKYKVLLEGFDADWIANTTKNATYTNLPAGHYTFRVMAYTDDINKASYAHIDFDIKQAFWKSWWFILLVLILLATGGYVFMKFRTRRIQLSNEKLESLIELRTREITKQKQEIETLYKEVHHRVKNNLQVINSIINLQSSYINDPNTLAVFRECQNRVYTMAVLHEKLYSAKDLTNNKLGPYIERIVEYLAYVYKNDFEVKTEINIDVNQIGLDTTIPIGLLINEIVSNSFKYAFDKSIPNKTIFIIIEQLEPKKYRMVAGDNGKGFEEKPDDGIVSFGLELINILVDQLNGTIRKLPEKGTLYEIIFFNIDKDITKTP